MTTHEYLTDKACRAINELFRDRSVQPNTTWNSLGNLRDEIDVLMDAIAADAAQQDVEDEDG